jgi:hypothetical protein
MIKIGDHYLPHTEDVVGPFANKLESSKFDYAFEAMTTTCTFWREYNILVFEF